jgi:YbbR domain-containing protein
MEPRDQRGQLVEGVSVDPSLTQVSLEIQQKEFSRALVISPQVVGVAAQGYNVVRVSVIPNAVTVTGPQSFIDEAVTIKTQPIDIEGADEYIVRTVSLDVPPGTKVVGNVGVTVTIEIVPALGQFVFAVPAGVTGLDGALSISGAPVTVQITLFGPLPQLLGLNPNDIAATVDLEGKDAGTHKVKVEVTAPNGLEARSISPEEIEITLENR